MKKHKLIFFIVHLVFWSIASFLFLRNAFIRPYSSILLESVVLFILMCSFYLSYFVLVPKLLMRRKLLIFFIISILIVILSSAIEMWVVESSIARCYMNNMDIQTYKFVLRWVYLFVSIRDACFILFADVFKLCEMQAIQLQLNQKTTLQTTQHLLINLPDQTTLAQDINHIVCLKYENRKTTIFRTHGEPITTYNSLASIAADLPTDLFIRINRNTVVAYSHIVSYDSCSVTLRINKILERIFIMPAKSEEILAELKQWNAQKYQTTNTPSSVSTPYMGAKRTIICNYIAQHPGCNSQEIGQQIHLSERNAQRILQQLKNEGIVDCKEEKDGQKVYTLR